METTVPCLVLWFLSFCHRSRSPPDRIPYAVQSDSVRHPIRFRTVNDDLHRLSTHVNYVYNTQLLITEMRTHCWHTSKNCVFGLQKRKKSAIKLGDVPQNQYLCNVFHGIRFKVNKGWDSAEPLFLYIYPPSSRRNLSFRRHSFLQFRYFSEA